MPEKNLGVWGKAPITINSVADSNHEDKIERVQVVMYHATTCTLSKECSITLLICIDTI
jgi:hypothetical protein